MTIVVFAVGAVVGAALMGIAIIAIQDYQNEQNYIEGLKYLQTLYEQNR